MLTGHWCYIHSRSTTQHLLKNAFFRCFECLKLPTNLYTVSSSQSSCECCWASLVRLILLRRPDLSLYFITLVPLCEKNAFVFLWIWREFQHQTAPGVQVAGICAKGREEWKENNKKTNEQISMQRHKKKQTNNETSSFPNFCSVLLASSPLSTWEYLARTKLFQAVR